MPAVNYDLMLQEMLSKAKGKLNQIVYWSRLLDWQNQTLTPNPDVIYLMPFFNTKDVGPIVMEIPPADGGSDQRQHRSPSGRCRSRMSGRPASTRARAAST